MLKVSLLGFKRNFSPSSLRLSSIPVLGSVQQRLPEPLWPSMALERASSTSLSTSGAPARCTLKIRTGVASHYARCAPALRFTGIFLKRCSCFSWRQYTFCVPLRFHLVHSPRKPFALHTPDEDSGVSSSEICVSV